MYHVLNTRGLNWSHQTLSQCLLSLACGNAGPLVGGNALYVVGMSALIWGCHGHMFILTPPFYPKAVEFLPGNRMLLPVAAALPRPDLQARPLPRTWLTCHLSSLAETHSWNPAFCAMMPQPLSVLMPPHTACASQGSPSPLVGPLHWEVSEAGSYAFLFCLGPTHKETCQSSGTDWIRGSRTAGGVCGLMGAEAPKPSPGRRDS